MRISDELKDARQKIERAMYEAGQHAEARVAGSGKRYGQKSPERGVDPDPKRT